MRQSSYESRARIAEALAYHEHNVAEGVTTEFFARHPDWRARYGARGWQHGFDDACFHLRFLSGSIAAGDPLPFQDYLRWTARVLGSRGMETAFLIENITQVREALLPKLESEDAELVNAYLSYGLQALEQAEATAGEGDERGPLYLSCDMFVQAILQGSRAAALNVVLEALKNGATAEDIYVDLLQEAMYRVGRKWENNEITVAQEHVATAITQYVVSVLYGQLPRKDTSRGNVVITATQGEQHQVGPMMLADYLEQDGWNVRFLGANVPAKDIAKTVETHQAEVLGISVTMLFSLPRVQEIIQLCREKCANLRVAVGGQAFRTNPELYREIGADGFATDLREAARLMRDWSVQSNFG